MNARRVGSSTATHNLGQRHRWRRRLSVAVVTVAVAALSTSCTVTQRNSLGTGASPCYRAIPTARSAVHDQGVFVGVRRLRSTTVGRRFPGSPTVEQSGSMCVVAYRESASPEGSRHLARFTVVIVTSPGNKLVRTMVLRKLPVGFRHL